MAGRLTPAGADLNGMTGWEEINNWRRAKRTELLARRLALPYDERARRCKVAAVLILEQASALKGACIGFYWPFKGEPDLRKLVRILLENGATAALPAVIGKGRPLEFRAWHIGARLQHGVWDIPVPANRRVVHPTVLLVPLLGFDRAGYRLGYGGGYYDRTLAAMASKPLTIGVGYETGRLKTIQPQPHDIPMDAIVTEAGLTWFENPPRKPIRARRRLPSSSLGV